MNHELFSSLLYDMRYYYYYYFGGVTGRSEICFSLQVTIQKMLKQGSNSGHRQLHVLLDFAAKNPLKLESINSSAEKW